MNLKHYSRKIEKLRNEYHKRIVQGICLYDVAFEGWYRLAQPPIDTLKSYDRDRGSYFVEPIEVKGIAWDGNIIAVDMYDRYIYLRYMDLSTENMQKIYRMVKKKQFVKVDELYSHW